MFKNVMVATDLSEASDLTLEVVPALKSLGLEEVTLVHSMYFPYVYNSSYDKRLAQGALQNQANELSDEGLRVRAKMLGGRPEREIPQAARDSDADLLVIGTRGASLTADFFLGGVTSRILQNMTVPIFLVRIDVEDEDPVLANRPDNLLDSVLFPTDFSDPSRRALEEVGTWDGDQLDQLRLLNAQEPLKADDRTGDDILDELEELKQTLSEELQAKTERVHRRGSALSQILEEARQEDASMIAMSSQGRGFISEVFLGSVSHQVARQAPSHVLLMPSGRE